MIGCIGASDVLARMFSALDTCGGVPLSFSVSCHQSFVAAAAAFMSIMPPCDAESMQKACNSSTSLILYKSSLTRAKFHIDGRTDQQLIGQSIQ